MKKYLRFILFIVLLLASGPLQAQRNKSSGNPSNDRVLGMSETQRAALLSQATGNYCAGKDAFYMGTETRPPNVNVSLWSIRCTNDDNSYMVAIAPDASGSTKVVQCNLLRKQPWRCYKKFSR